MMKSDLGSDQTFPPAITDAVQASIEKVYSAFCGETPRRVTIELKSHNPSCVAGIISFFGDVPWSLSWVLTEETAPILARKFAGFDIPFDSSDMGDVAGELVNVLAGEVIAQLEQRRIKAQMSLPTVARGKPLELVPEKGLSVARLDFVSGQGNFWVRLAAPKSGKNLG